MTNTNLNLRELIGNVYYNMAELEADIILAFETEEEVVVFNASNNVIRAYINAQEAIEYNILTKEVDGLVTVVNVEEFI